MSALERTTDRESLSSNIRAFDQSRRHQHATFTSGPSTNFSSDDPIPLFLSDPQDQPDPREFAPAAASRRKSVLTRVAAGGLVVSAFAILVAVAVFNSNVTRVVVDKATPTMGAASEDQSAMLASSQPLPQIAPEDPAPVSDPVTVGSVNASSLQGEKPGREAIVSASQTAPQSQAPAPPAGNEAAAPSRTLDAETLAALTTRARKLLALGDIAAARLLLERCANAKDATAAFLLAQTYDPAVLGARDARSTAPDPVMARDWYRTAASLGSADAQKRLTQLQD